MAIFTKKPEDDKTAVKYEVPAAGMAPSGAGVPSIPTVLLQPRISEKSGHLAGLNKYVFKVLNSANKVEVKKAVESFYKVRVTQVNIITNKGKNRNFSNRAGRTSDFKKAIVTLRTGDKITGLTDVV